MNELMHVMQRQIDACDAKTNDACNAGMIFFFWYMDGHSSHLP